MDPGPEFTIPIEITFVRHGETEANDASVWQGQGDSPLSSLGEVQVKRLAGRIGGRGFDMVTASDLGRTVTTAEALGFPFVADPAWRELDIGSWEGMTREEVAARFGRPFSPLAMDHSTVLGGGESFDDLAGRVGTALHRLIGRLEDGQHALVVTHGGAIHAMLGGLFGWRRRPWPWPVARVTNASLTTLRVEAAGQIRLSVYNDASHLDDVSSEAPQVVLVRHGETDANADGRWHGLTDASLNSVGMGQATLLAEWRSDLGAVFSSPLRRAMETAKVISNRHRVPLHSSQGLVEYDYGAWENLTTEQIVAGDAETWARYVAGEDVRRGGTGSTYSEVVGRMAEAIRVAAGSGRVGAVSHGGAIRSYVASVLDVGASYRGLLAEPANTSATTVALTERGPILVDYNLTPHLEA